MSHKKNGGIGRHDIPRRFIANNAVPGLFLILFPLTEDLERRDDFSDLGETEGV